MSMPVYNARCECQFLVSPVSSTIMRSMHPFAIAVSLLAVFPLAIVSHALGTSIEKC